MIFSRRTMKRLSHFRKRFSVTAVAGKSAVQHLKAKLVEYNADHNLRTVVALLLIAASNSQGVSLACALKVEVGQIVEKHGALQPKVLAYPFSYGSLDRPTLLKQLITHTVVTLSAT